MATINPLPNAYYKKVLPAAYDDSLSYYELSCKLYDKTNEVVEQVNENTEIVEAINTEWPGIKTDARDATESANAAAADAHEATASANAAAADANAAAAIVKNAQRAYESVQDMVNDKANLRDGMVVRTLGFHEAGDGGAALYRVSGGNVPNGMDIIGLGDATCATIVIENELAYKQFGAYCDSINDDYEPIKRCHEVANDRGVAVANNGIAFRLAAHNERIVVKTDTIFHECTAILENEGYEIVNDAQATSVSEVPLSTFFIDRNTGTAEYADKFLRIIYPYYRGNVSNELSPNIECYGANKTIWSLPPNFAGNFGDILVNCVYSDLDQATVVFSGLTVIEEGTELTNAIRCERHNTVIENIRVIAPNTVAGKWTGAGAIWVLNCSNVKTKNIVYRSSTDASTAHYGFRIDNSTNCCLSGLDSVSRWHSFNGYNLTDFTMESCSTELFDIHTGCFGNTVVRDCIFNDSCAIGYGFGTLSILDCYTSGTHLFTYRGDSALCYMGKVSIVRSNVKDGNYLINTMSGNNTDGINDIFKYNGKRYFLISDSYSWSWSVSHANDEYKGEIELTIENCTNARTKAVTVTSKDPATVVVINSNMDFSPDGPDNAITFKIYDSKFVLDYIAQDIEAWNSTVICKGSTISTSSIKLYDCFIGVSGTPTSCIIPNLRMSGCKGHALLGANMLAMNCFFTSKIGSYTYPQTGAMLNCAATSADPITYSNIAVRNCIHAGGTTDNENAFSFVDF